MFKWHNLQINLKIYRIGTQQKILFSQSAMRSSIFVCFNQRCKLPCKKTNTFSRWFDMEFRDSFVVLEREGLRPHINNYSRLVNVCMFCSSWVMGVGCTSTNEEPSRKGSQNCGWDAANSDRGLQSCAISGPWLCCRSRFRRHFARAFWNQT